jgi:hypothetical protein
MPTGPEYFYRIVDARRSGFTLGLFEEEKWYSSTEVTTYRYEVIKRTQCGVWLDVCGRKKFVKTDTRKKFACPSLEEAIESFRKRKAAQIRIYQNRATNAQESLVILENKIRRTEGGQQWQYQNGSWGSNDLKQLGLSTY